MQRSAGSKVWRAQKLAGRSSAGELQLRPTGWRAGKLSVHPCAPQPARLSPQAHRCQGRLHHRILCHRAAARQGLAEKQAVRPQRAQWQVRCLPACYMLPPTLARHQLCMMQEPAPRWPPLPLPSRPRLRRKASGWPSGCPAASADRRANTPSDSWCASWLARCSLLRTGSGGRHAQSRLSAGGASRAAGTHGITGQQQPAAGRGHEPPAVAVETPGRQAGATQMSPPNMQQALPTPSVGPTCMHSVGPTGCKTAR